MNNRLCLYLVLGLVFNSCALKVDVSEVEVKGASKFIIAHRGNWTQTGLPQNSRASLLAALSMDIYGTEFDVRETRDGVLVINHDPTYNGLNISESSYNELSSYKLSNGELLPTLEDFLAIRQSIVSSVKLNVELKECRVEDVVSVVNKFNLQGVVEYLSFNKKYCDELVNLGLQDYVYYLGGVLSVELPPALIYSNKYKGLIYTVNSLLLENGIIEESHRLGLDIRAWTVDDIEQMFFFRDRKVKMYTNYPWLGSRI